jgi:putative transposase
VSFDFFVVPTVRNKVLFVLLVLAHCRRRVVHFNVAEHPTAQQIIEAFPWDTAPKYLLRDRDAVYGNQFQKRVKSMGIEGYSLHREAPGRMHLSNASLAAYGEIVWIMLLC